MRAEVALKQPVQTILSGPAASCTGAAYLAQYKRTASCDTGGTTTDIALLRNNMPELNPAGAEVGAGAPASLPLKYGLRASAATVTSA